MYGHQRASQHAWVKVVYKQHYMESPPIYLARPLPGLATPQQGNKVILWESLSAGEKEESLKVLHKEKGCYLVQNQSKGQRGTGIQGAQSMHLYG